MPHADLGRARTGLSLGLLAGAMAAGVGPVLAALCGIGLVDAVIAAIHHAEVVAHRAGEPFGTLVPAVAVTESSLILSMMFTGGDHVATLPRETRRSCTGGGDHRAEGGLCHDEATSGRSGDGEGPMVVPQLRVLSAGYALAAGRYPFAGGSQAAVKISDAVTEPILEAAVDRRAGGGALQAVARWQWGDAERAIETWSSQLADGMHADTSGEKKP